MEAEIMMSDKEKERLHILARVQNKELTQIAASKELHLSVRQVRNLLKRVKIEGERGIISKKKGKPGNHRLPETVKREALALVKSNYEHLGPTLANHFLNQDHGIHISTETLRQWMIEEGSWHVKAKKDINIGKTIFEESHVQIPPSEENKALI